MNEKNSLLTRLRSALVSHPGVEDLVALSSSRDGFKRENAVRRLGMLGDPTAIPHLIVRANDWVPQVRAAAYDALMRLLNAGNGEAFVACLPELLHLQDCKRSDHSELLQAIQGFLAREENKHLLIVGMQHSDARVARLATQLLVRQKLLSPTEIITRGLTHADVIVRSIVVDLLRAVEAQDFAEAAARALTDSYMPVRREAFQQLLRRDPQKGLSVARAFLFDPSGSIREIAIHHLTTAGEPVEDMYARALTGHRDRVATVKCVLWGWALLNSQARIEQVTRLLDAPFPGVRRAALHAIATLLRSDAQSHLLAALADTSAAVCNEAARLIRKIGVVPNVEVLIGVASSSPMAHVATACCRVMRDGNKWDWLKLILSVYGSSDSTADQDSLSRELNVWNYHFNRSGAQPDTKQLESIVTLVRSSESKLSSRQIGLLTLTLRSYGAAV
jgi:HEAT repeat protein